MDYGNRKKRAKESQLCFLCLSPDHVLKDCQEKTQLINANKRATLERKGKTEEWRMKMLKLKKERAKQQRKSGQNYGLHNPAMKEKGLLPLSRKKLENSAKLGKEEEAKAEQSRRREGRKLAGEAAQTDWEQYKFVLSQNSQGLKATDNLDLRVLLLERSLSKDSQCLVTSHLAKTLAWKKAWDRASVMMGAWRDHVTKGSVEATRWKKASLSLELCLRRLKDPQASLPGSNWKAGRKFKVAKEEVEMEVARQMGLYRWADSGLYLFDEQDEALVMPYASWKPQSYDGVGRWI